MEHIQSQINALQQQLDAKDEIIHQLQLEAQGAAEAANAARSELAAQASQTSYASMGLTSTESVLKTLQTPQIIRDLPAFSGDQVKLHSFIRSIDNLMPIIEAVRNAPVYRIWIQAIRAKIVGEADNVLELYGTNLDWNEIKSNLITHYSDRRDETSLTRDLFNIQQNGTVEEFYSKISHIVSLMVNLLNINESNAQVKSAKNCFYQQMGLKVFLSGLKDPLGPIIRAQTPKNMKDALRLCLEESNYHYSHKYNLKQQPPPIPNRPQQKFYTPPVMQAKQFSYNKPFMTPFQPRQPFQQFPNRPLHQLPQRQPFHPPYQTAPIPFHPQKPQNMFQSPSNAFGNRNTFAPQSKPTPMEVDPSLRSRQINYMNRPHYQMEEYPQEELYYEHQIPPEYSYPLEDEAIHKQPDTDPISDTVAEAPPATNDGQVEDLNFLMDGCVHTPT